MPPIFVHASIWQKRGGRLIHGILTFPCDDHYRLLGQAISGGQNLKNNKVRHIMTQIASLLVAATVFTRLMICNVCVLQWLIRETKLPMQELELQCRGGG